MDGDVALWIMGGVAAAIVMLSLGQVVDMISPVRRITITDVTFARLARGETVNLDGVRLMLDSTVGTDDLAKILTDVAFDRAMNEQRPARRGPRFPDTFF